MHAVRVYAGGEGRPAMTVTQRGTGDEKPKALALPRGGFAAEAEEVLYEAGW